MFEPATGNQKANHERELERTVQGNRIARHQQ